MGMNVLTGNRAPVGFQTIADVSAATGLTVPENARIARITVTGNTANWRDDGTDPAVTAGTGGMPMVAGETLYYDGDLQTIKFIEAVAASTASVHISYYR